MLILICPVNNHKK